MFSAAIAFLIFTIGVKYIFPMWESGRETSVTVSTLKDAVNISELSTAQFTYNGIAEVYKDKSKKKVACYISYKAKVRAGIDMSKVEFEINEENKTVKPILPEITVVPDINDEASLSFIPDDANIELKEALEVCEDDAKEEALKSEKLMESAQENLHSIIEALLYPILNDNGYTLIW